MFEIGFSELLIVAVVALIVLGPERLPRAAQMVGLWVRKARAHWYSMKAELERDLAADELKRSLQESGRAIERDLRATADDARSILSPDAKSSATNKADADTSEPTDTTTPDAAQSDAPDATRDTPRDDHKPSSP